LQLETQTLQIAATLQPTPLLVVLSYAHITTAVLGLQPPGQLPPRQLPSRTSAPEDNCHPGQLPPGQLPPTTIATHDNCQQENRRIRHIVFFAFITIKAI